MLSLHASLLLSFQTTLPMFRNKTFTVRRRFSDFLGLYEKLSAKLSLLGCIIPPPPQKSVVGKDFVFHLIRPCLPSPVEWFDIVSQEWLKWRWGKRIHPRLNLWRRDEQRWRGKLVDNFTYTWNTDALTHLLFAVVAVKRLIVTNRFAK